MFISKFISRLVQFMPNLLRQYFRRNLPFELLLVESSASSAFENNSSNDFISLLSLSCDVWLCLLLPVLGRVIFTVLSFMEEDGD